MTQHAKQLHSFLPVGRLSSHRGHISTLSIPVTQLLMAENYSEPGAATVEAVKAPREAGKVPGSGWTGLLCVTVLWWESSDKKAQHLLW